MNTIVIQNPSNVIYEAQIKTYYINDDLDFSWFPVEVKSL